VLSVVHSEAAEQKTGHNATATEAAELWVIGVAYYMFVTLACMLV
jgi:hypothetical protein